MEWAYRMIAQHSPDGLGCAIILHLGWRDHPDFRTDRGIARALGKDRTSIKRATAKLVALGVIERRAGQWVACETVAICEETAAAPRPSAAVSDTGRGRQAPGGVRPPPPGASGPRKRGPQAPPKRKEKLIRRAHDAAPVKGRSAPSPAKGQARRGLDRFTVEDLTPFERSKLLAGESCLAAGKFVERGSPEMETLRRLLRSDCLEKGAA
jgi:hypothetical protein